MTGLYDIDLDAIAPRDQLVEGGFDDDTEWEKGCTKELTSGNKSAKMSQKVVALQFKTGLDSYKRGEVIEVNASNFKCFLNKSGVTKMANAKTKSAKTIIRELILKGKTDEQIIKEVHAKIADTKADSKHCTKYRRELFAEGEIKADKAALGSSDHREWAKANLAAAKKSPHKAYWVQWEKDEKVKAKEAATKAKAKPVKKSKKKSSKKSTASDLL